MKSIIQKKMRHTIALLLCFILSVTVLPPLPGVAADDSTIAEIPQGRYTLKNTALQLTNDMVSGTTDTAKKAIRLIPELSNTPVNISVSEYTYLHMWIYVSDADQLYDNNGDGIELCSGGTQDKMELALPFYYDKTPAPTINGTYSRLKTGWNEYMLNISDFTIATGGTCDLQALNFISLVIRSKEAGVKFAISKISAVNSEDFTDAEMPGGPVIPVIPAIPKGRYTLKETALQITKYMVSGTTDTAKKAIRLIPELSNTPVNISVSEYTYLHMWLYVSDADKLYENNGDSIELCSGGAQDKMELALPFYYDKAVAPTINGTYSRLKTGWNEYMLRISDFTVATGGICDLQALNFISLLLRSEEAGVTFAMSKVFAVNSKDYTDAMMPSTPDIPAIPSETARYTLKESALKLTEDIVSGTTAGAAKYMRLAPVLSEDKLDISEYDYLYTWIYISAEDLHNGDSIELCSGGSNDKNENAIRFNSWSYDKLHTGWNECMVRIRDFTYTTGGSLDDTVLNYIGIVLRSQTQALTCAVSKIYAVSDGDFIDSKEKDAPVITGNGKIGVGQKIYDYGESEAALTNGRLQLSAMLDGTAEIGRYTYVCTEIYIKNPALLSKKEGVFTISSSSKASVQELTYDLTGASLYEGWNTIFIPVVDFRMSGYSYTDSQFEGVCDLLNICRTGISWKLRTDSETTTAVIKLGRIFCTDSIVTAELPGSKYVVGKNAIAITTGNYSETVVTGSSSQLARLTPEINYGSGTSVDISNKEYLYFWLYISDASLDGSKYSGSDEEMELCSGGKCDELENAIRLFKASETDEKTLFETYGQLKTGWNEYLIPVSEFSRVTNKSGSADKGCDYNALNYLRIYFHSLPGIGRSELTYAISTVYAVNLNDLQPEPQTPDSPTTDDDSTTNDPVIEEESGTASVYISATANGNSAEIVLTQKQLAEIVSGGDKQIYIDLSHYENVTDAIIPASLISALIEHSDLDGMKITTSKGTISLNKQVLQSLNKEIDNSDNKAVFTLNTNGTDKTTVTLDAAVKHYDASGKFTKLTQLHNLDGSVTITVPYVLQSGASNVIDATYDAQDGTRIYLNASYDKGYIMFNTDCTGTFTLTVCPTGLFSDLVRNDWYHEGIDFVIDQKLMIGVSDHSFDPYNNITRGMFVTMLYRLSGSPSVYENSMFDDVDAKNAWYAKAVNWATAEGIIHGYGDGRFGPDDVLTREQLAVILWRFNGERKTNNSLSTYTDADSIDSWAMDAMKWCVENGLITGVDINTLCPEDTASRAQGAVILARYFKLR